MQYFPGLKTFAQLIGISVVMSGAQTSFAQAVVDYEDSSVDLEAIQQRLLGEGLVTESFEFSGDSSQLGLFDEFTELFGTSFDSGVVLSTGRVQSVITLVNGNDNASKRFSTSPQTDIDLGSDIYDPAKLTLTFTPEFDQLSLDFIFGSEEYNEYVHAGFNDRFEILVNGENCAKTPDGQVFSINTVNDRATYPPLYGEAGPSSNPELFINNDPGIDVDRDTEQSEPETSAVYATEMDGFTRLIRCTADVVKNEENRLVIGIVDVGDARLNSWVFLRAQSLRSSSNPDDSDGDGIPDIIESPDGDDVDTDDDGIADRFDLDSDNDGIPDSIEYVGDQSVDMNMDGKLDDTESAPPANPTDPVDTDFDGFPDYLDYESDSDGLTDLLESLSAGFSIADMDANNDGILDDTRDVDGDGLFDVVDPDVQGGEPGQPHTLLDLDNDGLYNYRDVDSDGDEFNDDIENGDYDEDGINDRLQVATGLETAVSGVGSMTWLPVFVSLLLLGWRRSRKL